MSKLVGAVAVAGGGIAGIQSAIDLANSGLKVYMIESGTSIGGKMAQLDKTFPTLDCSMCTLSPKLAEVSRHPNIELLTYSEITGIEGEAGNFTVDIKTHPRYIHEDKCIACGACAEKCPKKVSNEFNMGLDKRKAAYIKYSQVVPLKYAIDGENCIYLTRGKCRACEKFCPTGAINFDDKEKTVQLQVGSVVLAPGYQPFDPTVVL